MATVPSIIQLLPSLGMLTTEVGAFLVRERNSGQMAYPDTMNTVQFLCRN